MSDDLFTRVLLEALITEREGMIAENSARGWRGEAPAYDGEQFFALERQINILRERF